MLQSLFAIILVFQSTWVWSQEGDSFDVQLGEKLFMEGRFSQAFAEKSHGQVNQVLLQGDPILEMLETPLGLKPHPQRGQQVSCASCHFVDQPSAISDQFVLAYNDFRGRSPIPTRNDVAGVTLRNSMNMVLSSLGDGKPLHWDGEFYSTVDLACAAMAGRNLGWLPSEEKQAQANVVKVLREDDGTYPNDLGMQESYKESFSKLGIHLSQLTDEQIYQNACEVMGTFMRSLDFSRDKMGDFNGSAYDRFLQVNGLRRGLSVGESSREYLQYLRDHLNYKKDWEWVNEEPLKFHSHDSRFGPLELRGMEIFFTRGQCIACHTPPEFTNNGFHRTGISQIEYDSVHGSGAFQKLKIPNWEERKKLVEKYLTASGKHPQWQGVFAHIPEVGKAEFVDLGIWNVLGHPDKNKVQESMRASLCFSEKMPDCSDWDNDEFLIRSVAAFKTPTLRSLGQTAPYFHNGSAKGILDTLAIYMAVSHMARNGTLVNPDPMLKAMHIMPPDFKALEAFLQSLDEDYQ